MNAATILFVGAGVAIAVLGAGIVFFNQASDDAKMRQTGMVFVAAGLVVALLAAVVVRHPPHIH